MIDQLAQFTQSLPEVVQWAGVALVSAIPFVESYLGSAIGVVAGINPVVAVAAAVVGNIVSMLAVVYGADAIRGRVLAKREPVEETPRRKRVRRMFDRFGVPGVSLLGQWMLPSQITSGMMVSFGASRNAVVVWQLVSIVLWGIAFGTLAALGVDLLGGR